MLSVTIGVGGIPKVSRNSGLLGVSPLRARAADSLAAGASQAVTLATMQSVHSSPIGSERFEDITGMQDQEDVQLGQQAAAFAAQFMAHVAAPRAMQPPQHGGWCVNRTPGKTGGATASGCRD